MLRECQKTDGLEEYWSEFLVIEQRQNNHREVGVTILMKQRWQETEKRQQHVTEKINFYRREKNESC